MRRCTRGYYTHVRSNNIGTGPEDVRRTLNTNFGGEGSPTDRLWKRYRTELAERDKRIRAPSEAAEQHTDGLGLIHGLGHWLLRLVVRPA